MTGTRITVHYDDAPVRVALAGLAAAGEDMTPLMDIVGAYMETRVDERFETETGPGGEVWPKSIRALVEGGKTLTDTAALRGSITREATPRSVAVGTNKTEAGVHQFGDTIFPVNARALAFELPGGLGFHMVDSVTIPQRAFLGVDDQDEVEIGAIVTDYLADIAGEGAVP